MEEPQSARITQTVEAVIDQVKVETLDADRWYVLTYEPTVRFFKDIKKRKAWTEEKVLEGFCFVYSWMPRGVRSVQTNNLRPFAEALNNEDEKAPITLAGECVNHSMVAGSKFLHFYAPKRFAITDSFIQSRLGGLGTTCNTRAAGYTRYVQGLRAVSEVHKRKAQRWAKMEFGYAVTPLRAVEALLFYAIRDDLVPLEVFSDS